MHTQDPTPLVAQGDATPLRTLNRREFVRVLGEATVSGGLIAGAFAGYALTSAQRAEAAEAILDRIGKVPKVKLSKRLGNIEIARIAICRDDPPELIGPCLAAGMNFIHKAGYFGRGVPPEIARLPRESFYCDTTVDNTSPGGDPNDEEAAYRQVVNELEQTGLRYFDIMRAHFGWRSLASFNKGDNASYRAFKRLKREGKVRYFGVSQHAAPRERYETYATMIEAQIESGLIDSMQVWFSYASTPDEIAIFEKAHNAGIAITAMKTVMHGGGKMRSDAAKMAELKAPGMMGRACLRYVLGLKGANGGRIADCCVSALRNFDMFEENLGAVATRTAALDGFEVSV
ncbi:MAG TPA: aldo/keto reductase [Chthonomonadaceae bacterium]|nr:aldo/keto reductase [Chthonomonadaceae bacterium]